MDIMIFIGLYAIGALISSGLIAFHFALLEDDFVPDDMIALMSVFWTITLPAIAIYWLALLFTKILTVPKKLGQAVRLKWGNKS